MTHEKKTIAIIGGGAAGLGAAFLLDRTCETTLYEARSEFGGNALTVDFPTSAGLVPADLGVFAVQPWLYPNLFSLFDYLSVSTAAVSGEFGASFGPDDNWAGGRLREEPLGRRIEAECSRFELDMFLVANLPGEHQKAPLSDYVRDRGYSDEFLYKALAPVLAMFVPTRDRIFELPVSFASSVFEHHFSFFAPLTWRLIEHGTRDYIARLAARLSANVLLDTPVTSVTRLSDGVLVKDSRGGEAKFDEVIFAVNADTARSLLSDQSPDEATLLDAFEYVTSSVYMHADQSFLSPYLPRSAAFQYVHFGQDIGPALEGQHTYRVRPDLGDDGPLVTYFLSKDTPPPHGVVAAREQWRHLVTTPRSVQARDELHSIQGVNRTWFSGGYTTLDYHEGALVSGMVVAEALGAEYPFAMLPRAVQSFERLRAIMFP
jgi:predicted NAD/FAD-binding protein